MINGKHILLGVTGSIAAYKAAILVRLLVKQGAQVQVIMTEMSKHFITPLTLATLSKNPILVEFYNPENGDWNNHVSLGEWADLYLIAPASANTLAKMAGGIADNLLLTSYLSARCPVMVAPAMDLDMFAHPSTQANLQILKDIGVEIVEPASGELASGLEGKGRMEEPENILPHIERILSRKDVLTSKRVIVTAGPTVEPIDPVRYISNYSSGKMGYAIASEFARRGANVDLVSGPVALQCNMPGVTLHKVTSAKDMYQTTLSLYEQGGDIILFSAAVADYCCADPSQNKIKRKGDEMLLHLTPTEDIAAAIGQRKKDGTISVGFALETDNEMANAQKKLREKNLDMIVLNSLKDKGAGFAGDTNKISILLKGGKVEEYPLKSKAEVAEDIVDNVEKLLGCSKD